MKSQSHKLFLSLLLVVLAMPVGMVLAALLLQALSIAPDGQYGIIVTYITMFMPAILVSFFLKNLRKPRFSGFDIVFVLWGFVTILLWNCTVSPLAEILPDYGNEQLDSIVNTGLLSILTAVVIGPIIEEWIYRGIFTENLLGSLSPIWAVVLSSLLFSISHVYPVQVLTAFGAGMVLGVFYLLSGSLLVTIAIHILYNSTIYCLYIMFPTENEDILVDIVPSVTGRTIIWAVAFVLFLISANSIYRRFKESEQITSDLV